jgi:hypothetical protein
VTSARGQRGDRHPAGQPRATAPADLHEHQREGEDGDGVRQAPGARRRLLDDQQQLAADDDGDDRPHHAAEELAALGLLLGFGHGWREPATESGQALRRGRRHGPASRGGHGASDELDASRTTETG